MGVGLAPHPPILFISMARKRIGGTKTKLKGKLGSLIFRCKRTEKGKLECSSYVAPLSRTNNNTSGQIKARMIMGQIERMFHILPNIIKDAWIDVERGTLSFQHFSKINYQLLQDDFNNHFDSGNVFDWRPKYLLSAPAGPWILSRGDLEALNYDSLKFVNNINNGVQVIVDIPDLNFTTRQLLDYMGLKCGDKLTFLLFRQDEPYDSPYIQEVKFSVPRNLNLDEIVAESYSDEIIVPDDTEISTSYYHLRKRQFVVMFEDANSLLDYRCSCFAPLITRQSGDKFSFSDATFTWGDDANYVIYIKRSPADVYQTWQAVDL